MTSSRAGRLYIEARTHTFLSHSLAILDTGNHNRVVMARKRIVRIFRKPTVTIKSTPGGSLCGFEMAVWP